MMSTAKQRWSYLNSSRSGVLERGRACADLTIPSLLPPENTKENSVLPTPYQSLGARGVNHLASKLMLSLFPSSTAFFRFRVEEAVLDELSQMGDARIAVEEFMRKAEERGMRKMELGNLRSVLHTAIKHLIVTGNALLHAPRKGDARMYRLDQFCVVRDPRGKVLEVVVKEEIHPSSLSPEVRIATAVDLQEDKDKNVEIYTHIKRTDKDRFEWFQEINEVVVPDSEGRAKAENSPFIPLRWSDAGGEDYGRGMIEEYLGDLRSLEGLSKAIMQFSAVAAKIVFLMNPNSTMDQRQLERAESGGIVAGTLQDIEVLQLDKYADFQVSKAVVDELTLRLSHAFLLPSGTVRDAERVTAEEIRAMAQELEDVLGGTYTVLSQELQLPLVRMIISQLKADGEFPKLPAANGKPAIEPTIVTGFDALGRGHELNRYRAFIADAKAAFGEQVVLGYLKAGTGLQKFATAHNIDGGELIKTDEEVNAERQAAEQQAMMAQASQSVLEGATPGVVKGMADSYNQQ